MKLFHRTPEAHYLKTGINITYVKNGIEISCPTRKRVKCLAIYLAKENLGFLSLYFIKARKWRLTFKAVRYPNICYKNAYISGCSWVPK